MINTIIKGSFSVKVLRKGKVIKSLPRTNNLITRGGMDSLAVFGTYIHVGTGNVTPTFNDTSLGNFLAVSPSSVWDQNSSVLTGTDYLKESTMTATFGVGDVIGNLSELGVSVSQSETNDIQTRALFKDVIGDPTTITVTAQDQLVITYFIQKTISMVPFVSSISATLAGVPTIIDYTVRPFISTSGDAGSPANYPAAIYQAQSSVNFYLTVNDANRVSVDPVTFVPTSIDVGGETSPEGSHSVLLTATGNEVSHIMVMPIEDGNFQWVAATVSVSSSDSFNFAMFQIEFNGPNYINKTASDSVTFKLKETMNQVIV